MDCFVARTDGLLIDELDGGLVIYDTRRDQAHWLDAGAAAVWRACHDSRSESDIANGSGLDGPSCELALAYLVDLGLVETEAGGGYSRRVVLRTAAKVGLGGAVAAPIISAVVPVAAAHASTGPGGGPTGGGGGTRMSFTVNSGDGGAPGTPDLNDQAVYTGPPASGPPFPVGPNAFNVGKNPAWAAPLGGSNWISFDPRGDTDNASVGYANYTRVITVPAGASAVSISGLFLSDNGSQVYVDVEGNSIGDNSETGTSYTTPAGFSGGLGAGPNTLQFQVYNDGGPTGLDFSATVYYTI